MMMPGRKYEQPNSHYRFGFNGQEKSQEVIEGNTTALFWEYDSRIMKRWNVDPVMKENESAYLCFSGNPSLILDILGNSGNSTHTDKNGKVLAVFDDDDLGVYKHGDNADGSSPTEYQIKKRHEKSNSAGGKLMGRTMYWNAFIDDEFGKAGKINFGSSEAFDWIYKMSVGIKGNTKNPIFQLTEYAMNASQYEHYDYKTNGLKQGDPNSLPEGYDNLYDYMNRGSQISPGVYAPARDVGNFFAGTVIRIVNLDKKVGLIALGAFNLAKDRNDFIKNFPTLYKQASNLFPFYGELPKSSFLQRLGYEGLATPEEIKKADNYLFKDFYR